MARRRKTAIADDRDNRLPQLLKPKTEIEQRLQAQVEIGKNLLGRQLNCEEDLDQLREDVRRWDDFNESLLQRLFTPSVVQREYSNAFYGIIVAGASQYERFEDEKKDIRKKLNCLESILARLDIFADENPQHVDASMIEITNRVFVVHGHDRALLSEVARFLENIGVEPVILAEQPNQGSTVIEKFERHANVPFAVVLLTPDDVGHNVSESTDRYRARQNVILELGYFVGRLGRSRVAPLYVEGVEIPSDFHGVLYIPVDRAGLWQLKLAKEMKAAGIEIDLNKLA